MFFRDIHLFEELQRNILPRLIEARRPRREFRIWCAGCSTGQEPYSLAMIIDDRFQELLAWKLDCLASDISRPALDRARSGRYSQLEVNRGLPARLLVKYFEKEGNEWQLADAIKRMVRFLELNLNDSWPSLGRIDVVFMRNVMIYFDVEAKKRILNRLHRALAPDGVLFLGAAETTFNLDDRFVRTGSNRSGCYQLAAAAVPHG
jgi:chemotaxis protein methyltransferase CheR